MVHMGTWFSNTSVAKVARLDVFIISILGGGFAVFTKSEQSTNASD